MKKEERAENLYHDLTDLNEKYLTEAMECDSAEKLKKSEKSEKSKKTAPLFTPTRKKILILAACFLLIAAMLLAVFAFARKPQENAPTPSDGQTPASPVPGEEPTRTAPTIDTLDKIIYYGAIAALKQPQEQTVRRRATNMHRSLRLHKDSDDWEPIPDVHDLQPESGKTVIWELNDRYSEFIIRSAYYFEFDVEKSDAFLASKIGTGKAKAVVTVNNVNHMITVCDESEQHFFTCLANRQMDTGDVWYFEFSTIRHVEGKGIVYDPDVENVNFLVGTKNAEIVCFQIEKADGPTPNEPLTVPTNEGRSVRNVDYSDRDFTYTIDKLNDYFFVPEDQQSLNYPPETQDNPAVTTTGNPPVPSSETPDVTQTETPYVTVVCNANRNARPRVNPLFDGETSSDWRDYVYFGWTFDYLSERTEALKLKEAGEPGITTDLPALHDEILCDDSDCLRYAREELNVSLPCSAIYYDPDQLVWKLVFVKGADTLGGGLTLYVGYRACGLLMVAEE